MTTQVQFRRGTTSAHSSFTGAVGEVTVDTDLKTLKVHDGSTTGGVRIAKYSDIAAHTHTFSDESSTSLTVTPGTTDVKLVGSGGISFTITGDTITGSLASDINADSIASANSTGVLINDNLILAGNIQTQGSSEVVVENGITVAGNISAETLDINTISSNDSTEVVIDDGFRVTGTANIPTLETNQLSSGDSTAIQLNDSVNISGNATLTDLTASGTGSFADTLTAATIVSNTISSSDSTAVTIDDGLQVNGNFGFNEGIVVSTIVDEDDMSSDSATALASQQSIKKYVDDQNTATALGQSLKVSGDDSTNVDLIFAKDTPATLHFEGGTSITTSTTSAGNVKISLAEQLSVTSITSADSTEITIDRLRTQALIGDGSTAIQVEDAMNISGALNTETSLEINNSVVVVGILDEDDMTSDSGVHLVTQQSVKAYVDANSGATPQMVLSGDDSVGVQFNVDTNSPLQFSGGNSLSTSTTSTRTLTVSMDADITVNSVSSLDSTEVEILNIRTDTLVAHDSAQITVRDNLNVMGALLADSLTVNDISSSDSTAIQVADNVNISGALNAETSLEVGNSVVVTGILDEDDMSSDSAVKLATQQSIKAYVDTEVGALSSVLEIVGDDSTKMEVVVGTNTLQVSGGNSITTDTSSTQVLTVALDANITVDSIESQSSSEVEILNIRTDTLVAHDSTQITVRDAMRVTGTITGTVTAAQYADLAERYVADILYHPGHVMVFGGDNEITQSTMSHDSKIAGVVSTQPGFIMNNELENSTELALTGRVPCKVIGPIAKGDLVTSSDIPGVACKVDPTKYTPGCVIGKALENYDSTTQGVIEVVVGRL